MVTLSGSTLPNRSIPKPQCCRAVASDVELLTDDADDNLLAEASGASGTALMSLPCSQVADLLQKTPHSALADCTVQVVGRPPKS
jgi:hypothetical protein